MGLPSSLLKEIIDTLPSDWRTKKESVIPFLKKRGVKPDEIDASGIADFLGKAKGERVNKTQLQGFEIQRKDMQKQVVETGRTAGHMSTLLPRSNTETYKVNMRKFHFKEPFNDKSRRRAKTHFGTDTLWWTRTTNEKIGGLNTRLIQEAQSDIHQQGRRLGYTHGEAKDIVKRSEAGVIADKRAINDIEQQMFELEQKRDAVRALRTDVEIMDPKWDEYTEQMSVLGDERRTLRKQKTALKTGIWPKEMLERDVKYRMDVQEKNVTDIVRSVERRALNPVKDELLYEEKINKLSKELDEAFKADDPDRALSIEEEMELINSYSIDAENKLAEFPSEAVDYLMAKERSTKLNNKLDQVHRMAGGRNAEQEANVLKLEQDAKAARVEEAITGTRWDKKQAQLYEKSEMTSPFPPSPYKESWTRKALEQEILDATEAGQNAIAIPLEGAKDFLTRGSGVQKWYELSMRKSMQKLAKDIGGEYREILPPGVRRAKKPTNIEEAMNILTADEQAGKRIRDSYHLGGPKNERLVPGSKPFNKAADLLLNKWDDVNKKVLVLDEKGLTPTNAEAMPGEQEFHDFFSVDWQTEEKVAEVLGYQIDRNEPWDHDEVVRLVQDNWEQVKTYFPPEMGGVPAPDLAEARRFVEEPDNDRLVQIILDGYVDAEDYQAMGPEDFNEHLSNILVENWPDIVRQIPEDLLTDISGTPGVVMGQIVFPEDGKSIKKIADKFKLYSAGGAAVGAGTLSTDQNDLDLFFKSRGYD